MISLRTVFAAGRTGVFSRMVWGVAGSGGVWFLQLLVAFLSAAVLARVLGTAGYGSYAYMVSWVAVLSVAAALGYPILAVRELAVASSRGEKVQIWAVRRAFSRSVTKGALAVTAVSVGVIVASGSRWWSAGEGLILLFGALAIPFYAHLRLIHGELRGLGRPTAGQFLLMVGAPGGAVALFCVALVMWPPTALLAAVCYGAAAVAVWGLARSLVKRSSPRRVCQLRLDTAPIRRQFHGPAWVIGLTVLATVLNEQIPVLLTGSINGPEEAGLMDVARKFALLAAVGLAVINIPLGPVAAELYSNGETPRLQRLAVITSRVGLVGAIGVTALYAFVAPPIFGWLGEGFRDAYYALLILCIAQIVNTGAGPVGLLLDMSGNERLTARGMVAGLTTNLILGVVLVPSFGHLGGAVAASVGLVAWNLTLTYYLKRELGIFAHALASTR